MGNNIRTLFPTDIIDRLIQSDLAAQKLPITTEETITHINGEQHNYLTTRFPLADEAGVLLGTGVISIDIIMPEMDGYQLIAIVREKYCNVKIQLFVASVKVNIWSMMIYIKT